MWLNYLIVTLMITQKQQIKINHKYCIILLCFTSNILFGGYQKCSVDLWNVYFIHLDEWECQKSFLQVL